MYSQVDHNYHEKNIREMNEIHFTYIGLTKITYKAQCQPLKIPKILHAFETNWNDTSNMINADIDQVRKETKVNDTTDIDDWEHALPSNELPSLTLAAK